MRAALEPLGLVDEIEIEIDEQGDSASVSLSAAKAITELEVQRALEAASFGAGHAYRIRADSWETVA